MLVMIHDTTRKEPLAVFHFDDPCRTRLSPGKTYYLRLYAEKNDSSKPSQTPKPLERSDLMIMKCSRVPDSVGREPELPEGANSLILRVQFRVDNDIPIVKVLRWTFLQESETESQTFRIVLHVKPRVRTQISLLISVIGVLLLSFCFELSISIFTGREPTSTCENLLRAAVGVCAVFVLIGYFLLKFVEVVYTPDD